MKINYDCIRDILLCLENDLILNDDLSSNIISLEYLCENELLSQYGTGQIAYSILMLNEVNFIDCYISEADNSMIFGAYIYRLTYAGHEFIESIRPISIWNQVKSKINSIGSASIPLITSIAEFYLNQCISK